jgi:hypothetical protein
LKKKALDESQGLFLYDLGAESGFKQLCALWFEFFYGAGFYGTFSFVMDDQCALLGLFWRVAADADKRFDDMIESIDIVIVNDDLIVQ